MMAADFADVDTAELLVGRALDLLDSLAAQGSVMAVKHGDRLVIQVPAYWTPDDRSDHEKELKAKGVDAVCVAGTLAGVQPRDTSTEMSKLSGKVGGIAADVGEIKAFINSLRKGRP